MILRSLIVLIILFVWIWGCLAIFYAGPDSMLLRYGMLLVFIVALPVIFYYFEHFWLAMVPVSIVFAVFLAWWNTLTSTNDKDWAADVANIPYGSIAGDTLTLHNVRNFSHQSETDFTERWETRSYDLSQLTSLDLFLSYWGSPHIAHTILSWGFANGDYLAVSIETRKDKNQQYSAIKGFFKQYTLAYVAADERDLIRLRTNYRKEQVYVYRLKNISKPNIRGFLESYVTHMNKLVDEPEFYHALTRNCTSAIRLHSETSPDRLPFDWRLVANGHVDKFLYDHGAIRNNIPFAELRTQSRIDHAMQKQGASDFSIRLRKKAF